MPAYIEREALLAEFVRMFKAGLISMEEDVEEVIEDFPAADVAPVVHGEWKKHPAARGYSYCSICNDVYVDEEWLGDGKWSFCPNCGARIDGGRENGKL